MGARPGTKIRLTIRFFMRIFICRAIYSLQQRQAAWNSLSEMTFLVRLQPYVRRHINEQIFRWVRLRRASGSAFRSWLPRWAIEPGRAVDAITLLVPAITPPYPKADPRLTVSSTRNPSLLLVLRTLLSNYILVNFWNLEMYQILHTEILSLGSTRCSNYR